MRWCLSTLALICAGAATAADLPSFVGTWSTSYGQMRLVDQGGTITGTYGGRNTITGTVSGGRLTFTYVEPGVAGEGVFDLSADGQSFAGKWRENGSASWSNWVGKRVQADQPKAAPGAGSADEQDEPKPVVYRYGHLPKGLPAYFTEGDTDKDGQIGLYEWVQYFGNTEAALAEFKKLDLNGDGLLTVEEYMRARKATELAPASSGGQSSWGTPSSGGSRPVPSFTELKLDDKLRDPMRLPEIKK